MENDMSAAGTWTLLLKTPMGDQRPTLSLADEGGELVGTMDNGSESVPIKNVTLNGVALAWKADIKSPFPLTLAFTVTLDGDGLSGTCKPGMFSAFEVIGRRV